MKKRLLPILLLSVLAITGCANTPAEDGDTGTITTSEAADPVVNKVDITNKAVLQTKWRVGDDSRTVSFKTDAKMNIAEAWRKGKFTVTSSDENIVGVVGKTLVAKKDGYATITVKWKDTTVTDTVRVEVIPARSINKEVVVEKDIDLGGTYRFALYQKKLRKTLYFTETVENQVFKTNTDFTKGTPVEIVKGSTEGTVKLKVGAKFLKVTETADATKSGKEAYKYALTLDEVGSDFKFEEYNNNINTLSHTYYAEFSHNDGDSAYIKKAFIGTNGDNETITAIDADTLATDETASILHAYDYVATAKPTNIAEGDFLLGDGKGHYLASGKNKYNVAATDNPAEAVTYTIAKVEDKWTVQNKESKKYLKFTGGEHQNMVESTDAYAWTYDTAHKNFTAEDGGQKYKICYHGGWKEFCPNKVTDPYPTMTVLTPIEWTPAIGMNLTADKQSVSALLPVQLHAEAYPQGAKGVFEYSTSDKTRATVDGNGKVTTLNNPGKVTITAKVTGTTFEKSVEITVTEPVEHEEPKLDVKTVAELLSKDVKPSKLSDKVNGLKAFTKSYEITAQVAAFTDSYGNVGETPLTKGNNYGSMLLKDVTAPDAEAKAAAETIFLREAAYGDNLVWDKIYQRWVLQEIRDFDYNPATKDIKVDDKLKLNIVVDEYNDVKQIHGEILAINGESPKLDDLPQPEAVQKTPAEILAAPNDKTKLYKTTYKVKTFADYKGKDSTKASKEGGLKVFSLDGKSGQITIHSSTATAAALTFNKKAGIFGLKEVNDFITNELTNKIEPGWEIDVICFRDDYKGEPQINAIITDARQGDPVKIDIPEPAVVTDKNLEQVIAADKTPNLAYRLTVKVKDASGAGVFGNLTVTDEAGNNEVKIYGSTGYDKEMFWDKSNGVYILKSSNVFNINTGTKDIKDGDVLVIKAIRADHETTVQLKAVIEKINNVDIVNDNIATIDKNNPIIAEVAKGNKLSFDESPKNMTDDVTFAAVKGEGAADSNPSFIWNVTASGSTTYKLYNKCSLTISAPGKTIKNIIIKGLSTSEVERCDFTNGTRTALNGTSDSLIEVNGESLTITNTGKVLEFYSIIVLYQ